LGTEDWEKDLLAHLHSVETLRTRYARERAMKRIPVTVAEGKTISLTPGGQNVLIGKVTIEEHGKMPDVVIHHREKDWLVLIEAVTSHGSVNPKRRHELERLFAGSSAGLVYVTAFLDRRTMVKYLGDISWETEVWVAESPSHMIHFNGERFLGPH
jgi:hypothetical protein